MFNNNMVLCRLIFRRDRVRILMWFIGLAMLVVGFGAALPGMFSTEEGFASMSVMMENPAMIAMIGPYDGNLDNLGEMYALFMIVWTAVIMGIMNIFHVVRHTRKDEERGRIEVIRSLPVGRLSNLSSALTSALIINTAFALLLGLGLGSVGTESIDLAGSMLFGALMGAAGLVFAAATAVFCQLTSNPRTASGFSFAFLIAMYFVRAAGDMEGSDILSCLSPLGLVTRADVYTGNAWWPVFVALLASAVISLAAFRLCRSRDMGEGIIASKPGKRNAASYLKSPAGLAWRLLRAPVIIWAITIPALSMSYGSIMGDVDTFVKSIPALMDITGGSPMVMASFLLIIMSICSSIPVLQFILKARSQESGGYAEHIIARSASRNSQLSAYFIIALISCIMMPFLNCLGFWASCSAVMDTPFAFSEVFSACMVYTPAIMFMFGVAMVLIAYLPRRAGFAYGYLGYAFAVIYLGRMIGLPEWLSKLSPFGYVPMLPKVEELAPIEMTVNGAVVSVPQFGEATYSLGGGDIAALTVITALALAMFLLGFIGYRRRDMKFS